MDGTNDAEPPSAAFQDSYLRNATALVPLSSAPVLLVTASYGQGWMFSERATSGAKRVHKDEVRGVG